MSKIVYVLSVLFLYATSCGPATTEEKPEDSSQNTSTNTKTRNNNTSTSVPTSNDCTTQHGAGVPTWISENFTCVTTSLSGNNVIIETRDVPNYNSYYFGSGHANFEEIPSGNSPNPNKISEQNYEFTIPTSPEAASQFTDTDYDAIGVFTNGVVIYNNQAAPGDTLADEIITMDSGAGHPTPTGSYHGHTKPLKLAVVGDELIGIMRDGFPVYGPQCSDGSTPSDLDITNGHTKATTDFPDGIYHYHTTDVDPYIASKYRGTPGTMTNN